ncbi:MAG: hypothetical protein Q4G71_05510 [Pseudomonadota bacterium]|nr:hypothetical protein [Pseudomonadota bacterium]
MRRWLGTWLLMACVLLPLPARALGDAAWGYSYDFTNTSIQSDLVWRATRQATAYDPYATGKSGGGKRQAEESKRSVLDLGTYPERENVTGHRRLWEPEPLERLARQLYPQAQYAARRGMFIDLVLAFNDNVQQKYGVPKNNLATATALALVSSHAVYSGKPVPDAFIKPLVEQLQRTMEGDPKLKDMKIGEKNDVYLSLVGVGMWFYGMQADVQQNPDAAREARLRETAGSYFQRLAGAAPERVSFGRKGLVVR